MAGGPTVCYMTENKLASAAIMWLVTACLLAYSISHGLFQLRGFGSLGLVADDPGCCPGLFRGSMCRGGDGCDGGDGGGGCLRSCFLERSSVAVCCLGGLPTKSLRPAPDSCLGAGADRSWPCSSSRGAASASASTCGAESEGAPESCLSVFSEKGHQMFRTPQPRFALAL